jgi:hypothetical protein
MGQNFWQKLSEQSIEAGCGQAVTDSLESVRGARKSGQCAIPRKNIKISDEDIPMVKELLSRIMESFDDADSTSNQIKKRNSSVGALDPAKELDEVAASLHQKMDTLVKTRQGEVKLEEQTELTLYEEKHFTRLIEDISDSVNDLVNLFPAVQEAQKKLCEEEVSEMNKTENALSLLKDAADGQDNMLSDTVTKVIQSTMTYNNSVCLPRNQLGFSNWEQQRQD